jgi:hypothetical protein
MFQYVSRAIYKRIFHMIHLSVRHTYRCIDVQNKSNTCKEHTINCICKLCDTKQRPYEL